MLRLGCWMLDDGIVGWWVVGWLDDGSGLDTVSRNNVHNNAHVRLVGHIHHSSFSQNPNQFYSHQIYSFPILIHLIHHLYIQKHNQIYRWDSIIKIKHNCFWVGLDGIGWGWLVMMDRRRRRWCVGLHHIHSFDPIQVKSTTISIKLRCDNYYHNA